MKNKKIQYSERKGLAVRVLTVLLLLMAAGVGALRAQTATTIADVVRVVNFHCTYNSASYSLAWSANAHDGCQIAATNDNDPYQQWIMEDTRENNGNFYLLNVGSGTYLTIGTLNAWTMTFVVDPTALGNRAKFAWDDGKIQTIYQNKYLGLTATYTPPTTLFGDKTNDADVVVWTQQAVTTNIPPITLRSVQYTGMSLRGEEEDGQGVCWVRTTDDADPYQQWTVESANDGDNFYLKNVGYSKYLSETGNWKTVFINAADNNSKFSWVTWDNGYIGINTVAVGDRYLGVDTQGNGAERAYTDKDGNVGDRVQWYIGFGRVATPVIAKSGGSYTITCATAGADIYYTTDGSDPTKSATRLTYNSAITLSAGSSMIRAIAMKSGLVSSHIATVYTNGLYLAIHQAGDGNGRYLTVNNANAEINGDNDMPRWSDMYNNGNGIWVMTPEGYLKSEYYYLTVANNSLILTVEPKTQWELVDNAGTGRMDIRYNGMYLYYDGGTPPVQLAPNPANRYRACPITMTEKSDSWTEPTTDNLTLQSPQLLTYLRYYYQRKITFSFTDDNGTNRTRPNAFGTFETEGYVDRREYALLEYVSGGTGKGTDWDVTADGVIYNMTDHNVTVTATFRLTPADPIAAAAHTTYVEKEITFTLQPRYLFPDASKKYLLYNTRETAYRFPQGTAGTAENAQVTFTRDQTAQLTYPVNDNISWKIEDDGTGFYYLKNVSAGRYAYFDFYNYTGSDYGSIRYGATTVPTGDNRYKFRLYAVNNEVDIIPYEYQHVVFRNNAVATGIYSSLNTYASANVISLWKSNESLWRIYSYEFDAASASIIGPASATATGAYNFTATMRIKNTTEADLVTSASSTYQWTVTGLNDYVTLTDANAQTSTVTVNSMPDANTTGTVTVTFGGDEGITKSVPFRLFSNTTFENITSLSQITNATGFYRLTANSSDVAVPASSKDFFGVLDGGGNTVSGLTSPIFNTLSGTVCNLNLSGVGISGGENVGAVAQTANGGARIYNVGVLDGTVSGSGNVGSIVGLLDGSARVINCFSYATVNGGTHVGGIVGYNSYASTNAYLGTMVMNCMFYGNATGTDVAPIYNGKIINNNSATGLNNFNYFSAEDFTSTINTYNCALGAEKRFLTRFEFYRQILNSNRELAAWYVDGSHDRSKMYKWVLETADRTISNPKPYPVLRPQGTYPSIINIDAANAPDSTIVGRNHGGNLGKTLSVTISGVGSNAPTGASITTGSLTLTRTDKDFDRYNFNYDKVQLPYYNAVGTGNYTHNKVVTGWKITAITDGTEGKFTGTGADVVFDGEGNVTDTPYNFADRNCTRKDLYSVTGRVFSQGAYFDVPYGVTAITIEPYWAACVYLSDPYYDKAYNANYDSYDVAAMGVRYQNGNTYSINGDDQVVYTTMENAIAALNRAEGNSVFDYAVVLVGNYHRYYGDTRLNNDTKGFTIMSADLDNDNEPDNCLIYQHTDRHQISPIHFDFLCWPGIGMAQKPSDSPRSPGIGIFLPRGWFEVTNTCIARFTEFEYDRYHVSEGKIPNSPFILQGGVVEQFVTSQENATLTGYIHVGGNVWFKEFNNGCHSNGYKITKHIPISVTGGDYDKFYLSGVYQAHTDDYATDNSAECYISGGRFGEVAGAGMEQIKGDVYWQIYNADIDNFYGGGINAAQPITGNVVTNIFNSNVDVFCGGPKFGNMAATKTVTSTANGTTFGTFFGAGYGGTSYNRVRRVELTNSFNYDWNGWRNSYYNRKYDGGNKGIATSYEYEFFAYAGFSNTNFNVGRFYVNYASLSLAQTNDVTSTLTGCNITNNFYGGGNVGKVSGDVTSTLTDCTVGGNVFGAGFSAEVPTVDVMPAAPFFTEPLYDQNSGVHRQGVFPESVTYTWKQAESVSAGNEFDDTDGNHYILTTVDLSGLGLVTGNATLNIDGTTKVQGSVYGGGDEGTVGTFTHADAAYHTAHADVPVGKPYQCAANTGKTTVTVAGNAEIGPDGMQMPDDFGHVFGAGKGKVEAPADMTKPEENPAVDYIAYVNTTYVTISGNAFVKGSVYGGSESGHVLDSTYVKIQEHCQIGAGREVTTSYPEEYFHSNVPPKEGGKDVNLECASWEYKDPWRPYDPANGITTGTDGHTFYGNVFGGGSGYNPYTDGEGKPHWLRNAGVVERNARLEISGGHILTSAYGGNEMTDVKGKCTVVMTGGTLGVPRTLAQIAAHPVTCYLFGAGKGDMRDGFNDWNNVGSVDLTVSGGWIYGSVFGGGEDGHVLGDVKVTIDGGIAQYETSAADITQYETSAADIIAGTYCCIGSWGTSYVDGNIFGGGRGFSGEALTAGGVGGNVEVNITGGRMLGSIYGGGRLGSVGSYFVASDDGNYGKLQPDDGTDDLATTDIDESKNHGYITVNISGGIIGGDIEFQYPPVRANMPSTQLDGQNRLVHTRGGNVFTGCMGRFLQLDNENVIPDWEKLGRCKGTTLNITDGTIKGCVYGGSELGTVGLWLDGEASTEGTTVTTINMSGGTVGSDIIRTDGTDGADETVYSYGSVFGGSYGSSESDKDDKDDKEAAGTIYGNTEVTITGGEIKNNVYGGGNNAKVTGNTEVTITGGEIKDNVYGGGNNAKVTGNTNVVIGKKVGSGG